MVRTQQPQCAYHPQDNEILDQRGRQERGDDNQIGETGRMEYIAQSLPADEQAGTEFHQIDNADRLLDDMQFIGVMIKRGNDEIDNGDAVERQQ